MTQVVRVTDGAAEFTYPIPITETDGDDISDDSVAISLGTRTDPGLWQAPDIVTRPAPSTVVAQKLVDNRVPPGTYWVWVQVIDSPEIVPRRGFCLVVI